MKVLLTGATGFIGNHVVGQLLERGHQVVAIGRSAAHASRHQWYENVDFRVWDLHAAEAPFTVSGLGSPDVLMHLAWPGLPNYKELFHFERNLLADYLFIKTLVLQGLQRVLVTGTCFEYGMRDGCLNESMPTFPANPYALAKDTLRKFLEALQVNQAFTMVWCRLFYMHGPGQNPNSLLAQLDAAIARGDTEFPLSGGEQLRDYLPVEAVADRLATLLEHDKFDGVVNICSGEAISIRRLVTEHLARKSASIRLNFGSIPYSQLEPMAFWGSGERYKTITGFHD
jgi:nucleoside-diphosphate-sugar epimerase